VTAWRGANWACRRRRLQQRSVEDQYPRLNQLAYFKPIELQKNVVVDKTPGTSDA